MSFPSVRLRRLRCTPALRSLVRETVLTPQDFVQPYFVVPGRSRQEKIASLPGVFRWSVDRLVREVRGLARAGVPGVMLFGVPERKDGFGSGAWDPDGPVARACRALKDALPELVVMADVCLCEYTSHGHCGLLDDKKEVDNDATLEVLARVARAYAEAGADWVAPSGMMDGGVAALRRGLDEGGFSKTLILSYAIKQASVFYGPFREAAGSAPSFGDRRGYQMDPANRRQALREAALDEDEGADALMVKPGLTNLDLLSQLRQQSDLPLAVYQVSGEYAMVKAAAARGWLDESAALLETLLAMKRAGADFILTYGALQAARAL